VTRLGLTSLPRAGQRECGVRAGGCGAAAQRGVLRFRPPLTCSVAPPGWPVAVVELEADYVVVGAGAMGIAFTDALIDHADVSVVMVVRRYGVGGTGHVSFDGDRCVDVTVHRWPMNSSNDSPIGGDADR